CSLGDETVKVTLHKDHNLWEVSDTYIDAKNRLEETNDTKLEQLRRAFAHLGTVEEVQEDSSDEPTCGPIYKLNGERIEGIDENFLYEPNTNKVYQQVTIKGTSKEEDGVEFRKNGLYACDLVKKGTAKAIAQPSSTPSVEAQPVAVEAVVAPVSSSAMQKAQFTAFKNQPLFVVMAHFVYANKKQVRKQLAQQFGIKDYKGTKAQNIELKNKLLSQIEVVAPVVVSAPLAQDIATVFESKTFSLPKKDFASFKNQPLFVLVQHFGFDYKKDRKALAAYFGIKNYVGTFEQNVAMKKKLLEQIVLN
ncbi:MAG: hypothetical protein DLD55_04030, partial [candidate division SR1 bacterium]